MFIAFQEIQQLQVLCTLLVGALLAESIFNDLMNVCLQKFICTNGYARCQSKSCQTELARNFHVDRKLYCEDASEQDVSLFKSNKDSLLVCAVC